MDSEIGVVQHHIDYERSNRRHDSGFLHFRHSDVEWASNCADSYVVRDNSKLFSQYGPELLLDPLCQVIIRLCGWCNYQYMQRFHRRDLPSKPNWPIWIFGQHRTNRWNFNLLLSRRIHSARRSQQSIFPNLEVYFRLSCPICFR